MLSLFMAIANGVSWHELVAPLRLEFFGFFGTCFFHGRKG